MHGTSPAFQARVVYESLGSDWPFTSVIEMHLLGGYVVSTPEYFILARPVDSTADEARILNPLISFSKPDAWFIFAYAGDISRAWDYFPVFYPKVGWQRANRPIRFYPMENIIRKVKNVNTRTATAAASAGGSR